MNALADIATKDTQRVTELVKTTKSGLKETRTIEKWFTRKQDYHFYLVMKDLKGDTANDD